MLETFLIKDKIMNLDNEVEINTPDVCPYCKKYIYPHFETTTKINDVKLIDNYYSIFAITYSCPACKNFIFKTYTIDLDPKTKRLKGQEFFIDINK